MNAKLQLKRQTLETKRAREARANLKNELKIANNRILEVESLLKKQLDQIEVLKKKQLLMKMT